MIFQLAWSWYEEYRHWLFENNDKTQEEFDADCKRAIRECGEEYLKSEESWIGAPDWIEYASNKLLEYGYKAVCPVNFEHFGTYIIEHEERKKLDGSIDIREDDMEFKEIIGEELYNKAVEINKKIDEKIHKEK